MSEATIHRIKLQHLRELERLFKTAAHSSFSYLPANDLNSVISDNNLRNLTISWLHPKRVLIGLSTSQGLQGYVIGSIENSSSNLYWLYVDPTLRGKNYGLKLLTVFIRHVEKRGCRNLNLATHTHQPYYQRQGFKHVSKKMIHGVPMDIMSLRIHG